jgi:hypothetical protein
LGTTWDKIGATPAVKNSGGRFSLNVIGAVTPRGDMRFSFIQKRETPGSAGETVAV